MFQGNFEKLFSIADRECEIYKPVDVIQTNTTEFDQLADQGDNDVQNRSRKISIEEAGILLLRSAIRHVPKKGNTIEAPKFLVKNTHEYEYLLQSEESQRMFSVEAEKGGFSIPEIDWQAEVDSIMRYEDDSDSEKEERDDDDEKDDIINSSQAEESLVVRRPKILSSVRKGRCKFISSGGDIDMRFMRRLSIREVAPFFCFEPDSVNFSDESLFQDDLDIFVPNPSFPDSMEMEGKTEQKFLEHDVDRIGGLRVITTGSGQGSKATAASHTSSSLSSSQDAPPLPVASFPTLMGASAVSVAGIMTLLQSLVKNYNCCKYYSFFCISISSTDIILSYSLLKDQCFYPELRRPIR
jgi:hypothetical protein